MGWRGTWQYERYPWEGYLMIATDPTAGYLTKPGYPLGGYLPQQDRSPQGVSHDQGEVGRCGHLVINWKACNDYRQELHAKRRQWICNIRVVGLGGTCLRPTDPPKGVSHRGPYTPGRYILQK